jgi:hypothetical protein
MKIKIQEEKFNNLINHLLKEDNSSNKKERCTSTNVVSLDNIVGPPKDYENYTSDLYKRNGGINGITDTLDILKTLRLHPNIKDGGEHLSYDLMNHLNKFRGRNYFDETNKNCLKAMDKVIELYRENEHGEDLVKDIEKVLKHTDPTPRAKEYLKRCQVLIKEK